MRVISGTARGRRLKAPRGTTVRPTADRVKEALFNILGAQVGGSLFIDLFAGSGAVGIEALSRGAGKCIFVESNRQHMRTIMDNLETTGLTERARLILLEVHRALPLLAREKTGADLVFIDPPYRFDSLDQLARDVLDLKLVAETGLLVIEHSCHNRAWTGSFEGVRQEKYGDTCLAFIRPDAQPAASPGPENL